MKILLSINIIFILWILYSIIEGKREAFTFHHFSYVIPQRMNPHYMFSYQRFIVLLMASMLAAACSSDWWAGVFFFFFGMLCFPFIHDGIYYKYRNIWNNGVYHKGFKSNGPDTKGKFSAIQNYSYRTRQGMFILGVIGMAIINLIILKQ